MKILITSLTLLAVGVFAQSQTEPTKLERENAVVRGTLTIPTTTGKIPVALLIAGSGATDQNGNSLGSPIQPNSYTLLATSLAEKGVATLRYDKRGIGSSSSTQSESQTRFTDFSDDAALMLQGLKTDQRFSSIYVIGHSEGSLLGMLAAQKTAITGFISLAGAGRPIDQILLEQLTPQVNTTQLAEIKRVLAVLKNGQTIPAKDISLPAQLTSALFRDSVQPYLISWIKYDPAEEIKKLATSVLVMQGTTDVQVSVKDATRLATAVGQQPVLLENVNHVLKTATLEPASQNAAYTNPKLPIAPSLIEALVKFIQP
ncbi:MAG: hypothetical protein RLZZ156_2538 [Deinococcota bacterium]